MNSKPKNVVAASEAARSVLAFAKNLPSGSSAVRRWKHVFELRHLNRPLKFGAAGEPLWKECYDDTRAAKVIAEAINGDRDAHIVLSAAAGCFLADGQPLPARLGKYVIGVLNASVILSEGKRKEGRPSNPDRDSIIFNAVLKAAHVGGLKVTRNIATDGKESACSVVASAANSLGMKIGEKQIERVYQAKLRAIGKVRFGNDG